MTDTTTPPTEDAVAAPPAPSRPGFGQRVVARLKDRDRTELLVWAALVAVAALLRLYDLGSRPFHHDESQDAYFSDQLSISYGDDASDYQYNPLLHGPVRFYVNKLLFVVFHDSDFTARLQYALAGIALVALPYLLRRQLGRTAALSAGVMLAISPSILYYSRFAREDILLVCVLLAFTVACFRFIERPRTLTLCAVFGLVAIAFGIKESGLVMVGLAAVFFLGAGIVQSVRATDWREGEIMRAVRGVGWPAWIYAISTLIVIYAIIFTVFFSRTTCMTTAHGDTPAHSANCLTAVVYGLQYWMDQQDVARGGDRGWLYYSILVGHEWPILLTAAVGVIFTALRPTTLKLFLIWMTITVLAFHWWGKERFPWLIVHPLVPMILLSGVGIQGLWSLRSRPARGVGLAAVGLGALYLVIATFSANAKHPVDPANMLVSTQSSDQVKQVVDQVHARNRKLKAEGKPPLTITIDSSDGATFPYAWYFRDDSPGYIDMTQENYTPTTQVLIMTEASRTALKPNLAAYEGRPFDFRIWWVKKSGKDDNYHHKLDVGAWWDWWTKLKTWTPTGGMKEWFYLRRDAGTLPGKGTKTEIPTPPPVS